MNIRNALCILSIALVAFGCRKDDEDAVVPTLAPAACGINGMRLQGTVGGTSFCANASLFADLATVLTANGVSQTGTSLTMELDSLSVGSHVASATANTVLHTDQLGLPWNSADAAPATVNISSHDTTANRIQGSITGSLYAPAGGESRAINVSFDLTYLE